MAWNEGHEMLQVYQFVMHRPDSCQTSSIWASIGFLDTKGPTITVILLRGMRKSTSGNLQLW
jgi:hypothetical protein